MPASRLAQSQSSRDSWLTPRCFRVKRMKRMAIKQKSPWPQTGQILMNGRENLLLEKPVPGIVNNQATKQCSSASLWFSHINCGGPSINKLSCCVNILEDNTTLLEFSSEHLEGELQQQGCLDGGRQTQAESDPCYSSRSRLPWCSASFSSPSSSPSHPPFLSALLRSLTRSQLTPLQGQLTSHIQSTCWMLSWSFTCYSGLTSVGT